jgi:uncharacterized protein YcbX
MGAADVDATVSAVWRFPVKSMLGEELDAADVNEGGIVGDRAFALVDTETGKVVSAKHPTLWPDMLRCTATFAEPPRDGWELPAVRIDLADGTSVLSDAPDVDAVLSRFFGREVVLARSAPEDYTIDQYHPDVEDLDPEGHRNELTETKLGAAFFRERGLPSAVPEGSFKDLFPISVLTTSTLDHLGELRPESRFDVRRFRMNVIVDTPADGFVENTWVGRALAVGEEARLAVAMPDPRCAMPTLAQPGLPADKDIVKTLVAHNRIDLGGGALFPCAGVYAVTANRGTIRRGDAVTLS